MTTLRIIYFGNGVMKTVWTAYELSKDNYKKARDDKYEIGMDYYGKEMMILHDTWCKLEELDRKFPFKDLRVNH